MSSGGLKALVLLSGVVEIASTRMAFAGWDLEHAGAVEDLLADYIRTLPGGHSVELPRLFITKGRHIRVHAHNQALIHLHIALVITLYIWKFL